MTVRGILRLAEGTAGSSLEQATNNGTSSAFRFLARLLTLTVSFIVWLLVLTASAFVLLIHLLAVTLARGSDATLSAVLAAEAAAKNDFSSAFARLSGRG